jgi:hypothetical protein
MPQQGGSVEAVGVVGLGTAGRDGGLCSAEDEGRTGRRGEAGSQRAGEWSRRKGKMIRRGGARTRDVRRKSQTVKAAALTISLKLATNPAGFLRPHAETDARNKPIMVLIC